MSDERREHVSKRFEELIAELDAHMETMPREDLPALIGSLSELSAFAMSRLVAAAAAPPPPQPALKDRLLTVQEAAEVIGLTARWVRRHARELPRVELPGGRVRFSERRLQEWLKRRG